MSKFKDNLKGGISKKNLVIMGSVSVMAAFFVYRMFSPDVNPVLSDQQPAAANLGAVHQSSPRKRF